VGSDGIDLVGRQVEAIVAPVLEEQVVALDAAQGACDQTGEAGHAVLLVDDMVPRREVLEDAYSGPAPWPGPPSGPAATGQLGLGDHSQSGTRQDEPPLHGGHH